MGLDEYRKKRQFAQTTEPDGSVDEAPAEFRFVVQKHHARNLHYDLRLEYEGVLKSWAVPKGPSLDPKQKRLAIHVEDHPIEYLDFEGVIPKGEYGAGPMLVWDIGTWRPLQNFFDFEKGELKFVLNGHKLQGGWMLVRTGGSKKTDSKQWLFFKERDNAARSTDEIDILSEYPNSVKSGLSLDEVKRGSQPKRSRKSNRLSPPTNENQLRQTVSQTAAAVRGSARGKVDINSIGKHAKSRKAALPKQIKPALPSACRTAPEGDQWLHEIKFDGYRMLCRIEKGKVQFLSRNGKDWTGKLKRLAKAVEKLQIRNGILDGEVVMMADDGTTSFQALQNRIGAGFDHQLRYYIFDLLHLKGYDLKAFSLVQRKNLLRQLLSDLPDKSQLFYSDHIQGNGPTVFQQACNLGAEGIVSKRSDSQYVAGRITSWLKTKCLLSQEFVVGGFSDPASSRPGFGALVIGYFNDQGELCYAGRVGTGFTDQTLTKLKQQLDAMAIKECPFDRGAEREKRGVHWVEPSLVIEVEFAGWTADGVIRFPSYRGLRDDLSIEELDPINSFESDNEETRSKTRSTSTKPPADVLDTPGLEKLKLTNADRIVYPEAGISKLGVATYFAQAAKWMLPHIVGRPLSLLRCPQGCHEKCFFQKRAPMGLSESVERIEMPSSEGPKTNLVIHDVVGLLALVQFGVLEFHVWGARSDEPLKPDRMIFDLDPDPILPWRLTVAASLEIRDRLAAVGLTSFVKTSGGKGLHIVVPLRRRSSWQDMKSFSDLLAAAMIVDSPGRYTNTSSKRSRSGKIYIDCLRNVRGATSIAAYSTRARESAAVSLPVQWHELETLSSANYYTLKNINRRFQNLDTDPWAQINELGQSLTKSMFKNLER